jgi:hypothetical protein
MKGKPTIFASAAPSTIVLSLCLLCGACISIERYPGAWSAPQIPVAGCPDLTGTYLAEGLVAPATTGERLDKDLFDAVGATSIVIAGPKDAVMTATAMQDQTILGQTSLDESKGIFFSDKDRGKFKCNEGTVIFLLDQKSDVIRGLAVGASEKTRAYRKAVDGALIVHTVTRSGGITLLFPFYSSRETWAIFPSVKEAGTPK